MQATRRASSAVAHDLRKPLARVSMLLERGLARAEAGEDVRADTQLEIFDKAPDDTVVITTTRTDSDGIAVVPVIAGHSYMLDAVVLREPSAELASGTEAVWETLWANLTFGVPD